MIIKNAKLKGYDNLVDISVKDGVFVEIGENISSDDSDVIDAAGHIVVPPFIEPHIHLDTTLTAGEPSWNMSGTLFEGIQRWAERKESLTVEDVKKRAKTVLKWHIANGVQFTRTHVDITDPDLIALKAMVEVREEMKEYITVQIVAFPQEGIFSYKNGPELMRRALDMGADVIGAIPHFEFTREYGVQSIDYIFELAKEYGKQIDVHCDEIDDEQSRFVEVLATRALEHGIGDKVTASHTTAMHSYNGAYAYKLFRLLKLSGISFIANPLVNIHLQGRFDTYPKRRGITRVKEMLAYDINVCFGHDDVFDPWYPLGTANMLQVLHMGLHVCQIMGYEQIDSSLELISVNSAQALGVQDIHGIEVSKPASFIVLDADSGYDAVRRQSKVLYSVRNGKIISKTAPAVTEIFTDSAEIITYQK